MFTPRFLVALLASGIVFLPPVANAAPSTGFVAAGANHSVAIKADGSVWAWGVNTNGQLGDGTTVRRPAPILLPGITTAASASAGDSHSVLLLDDGTVRTWGLNTSGQLGPQVADGASATPTPVSNLNNVTHVSAGDSHACALLGSGSVRCWGYNYYGQLGNGTTVNSSTPVQAI